jgi:hypothetical protein
MRSILLASIMLLVMISGCISIPGDGQATAVNRPPVAYIDSISPSSPAAGEMVNFAGHGTDVDGTVVAYRWRTAAGRELSSAANFDAKFDAGNHIVYLKVQDNNGLWSDEVRKSVEVGGTPQAQSLPVINMFSANPSSIASGGSVLLNWDVTGATSVSIDQGVGSIAALGSITVTPGSSVLYTLTAANGAGSITASAPVVVGSTPPAGIPVINSFTASPANVLFGGSTTLSWNVSGATSIAIDHGIGVVNPSGSKSISPVISTTYLMTASNAAGWVTQTVAVHVNVPPISPSLLIKTTGALPNLSAENGSITKEGATYTKYAGCCAGDNTGNGTRKGFLSFDISSIPAGSTIKEATLDLSGYSKDGNPTWATLGNFQVYFYQYGTYASLDAADYNAAGKLVKGGTFSSYPSPWKLDVMESSTGEEFLQGLVDAHRTRSQYKIQFTTPTDGDGVLDFICLNNATLTIKYTLP